MSSDTGNDAEKIKKVLIADGIHNANAYKRIQMNANYNYIESMSFALGISRVCFWKWCNGSGVSQEWQEHCLNYRQIVASFLEQAMMTNKVGAIQSIFLFKNWMNYKDSVEIVENVNSDNKALTLADLPKLEELHPDADNKRIDNFFSMQDIEPYNTKTNNNDDELQYM